VSSDYSNPKECSVSSDCPSNAVQFNATTTTTYNETCSCGYNLDGQSYCELHNSDSTYEKYTDFLENWFESDSIKGCNSARRTVGYCAESRLSEDEYSEFNVRKTTAESYPYLVDNDDCVEAVFFGAYYDDFDDFDDDDDDFAGILSFVALFFALN
jgi:hypothetical protein